MVQRAAWLERRFSLDLPISMFPNVLERLRGTPARVADRIRGLPDDVLRKRSGESWSILENIGHLVQAESLWLLRLDDYDAGLEALRPADMTNRATEESKYNEAEPDALLETFRQARRGLVGRLEALDEQGAARSAHHPRLNRPMRVLDLMVFAAEHDDHHLVRITELLRQAGA
ncbi:MAG: DinB family protein [Acidobacteriota bacterium]